MKFKVLVAFSFLSVVAAFPGKLLRVPKIYNALITTKEKLLPSEAYPATTGPIFQPVALSGEPILLNANEFINSANQQEAWRKANQNHRVGGDNSSETSEEAKDPSPVVFYPRYGLYYPHHTVVSYVNTLQHSFVYTTVDRSKTPVKFSLPRMEVDRNGNVDGYVDDTNYPRIEALYAKNNRRSNIGIPDVPPPPLPVSYSSNDQEGGKEIR